MTVKMIQNLGNRMEKIQETFNKDLEELKSKQTMMNNTMNEIKNSLEGINSRITEAIEIKAKINKWDLIKLISFCTAKETINKTKRQPTDWEKILANDATDKGLLSKINKQILQFNSKKNKQPN